MTDEPYGAKGCTCWAEPKASDPSDVYWAPNSGCRFHGVLAEFLPPRTDTGVYRVIDLPGVDLSAAHRWDRGCEPADFHEAHHPADGSRCPGDQSDVLGHPDDGERHWTHDRPALIHQVKEPLTEEETKTITEALRDPNRPKVVLPERCVDCGSTDVVYHNYRDTPFCCPCAKCCDDTTGKERRGIFAALRRWGRHIHNNLTRNGHGWL